ncbi:hypothetical protein JB92DRAFT_2827016 [Gautieria morchelliformis]|nr:hypothetical protein JB92DRAFT_2827016 [Gautieria morchelliformis]
MTPITNSTHKVQSQGSRGLEELEEEFSDGRIQYTFVRVKIPMDGIPEAKKGLFHTHSSTVGRYLEGTPVIVNASTENLSRLLSRIPYADLVLASVLETIILVAPEEWRARVKHWDGDQDVVHGPVSAQSHCVQGVGL